jgi:uncharacterized protein YjbI with pentapeptide repeats
VRFMKMNVKKLIIRIGIFLVLLFLFRGCVDFVQKFQRIQKNNEIVEQYSRQKDVNSDQDRHSLVTAVENLVRDGVSFERSPLFRGRDFSGANLQNIFLEWTGMDKTNLNNADLRNGRFHAASIENANLAYANLSGSNLRTADVLKTDLNHADFSNADLWRADFTQANLSHVNFSGASLSHTNLSRADLSYSNFRKANLDSTVLLGANLQNVQGLTQSQLSSGNASPLLCNTKIPNGFTIDPNRDCAAIASTLLEISHGNVGDYIDTIEEAEKAVNQGKQQKWK